MIVMRDPPIYKSRTENLDGGANNPSGALNVRGKKIKKILDNQRRL